MAIQLQVRNRYGNGKQNEWMCDGETNRNKPTKFMLGTAREYRREMPDYEVRFVYDKDEFVN